MRSTGNERKSKFTASVRERLVRLVDEKARRLDVTRSEVIEEAMEMWLSKQEELEEERYFQSASEEMNKDAKEWNALTSNSLRKRRRNS